MGAGGCPNFREISEAWSLVVPCSSQIPIARSDRITSPMEPRAITTPGRTYRSCRSFGLPPTLQARDARVSFILRLRFIGPFPRPSPNVALSSNNTKQRGGSDIGTNGDYNRDSKRERRADLDESVGVCLAGMHGTIERAFFSRKTAWKIRRYPTRPLSIYLD